MKPILYVLFLLLSAFSSLAQNRDEYSAQLTPAESLAQQQLSHDILQKLATIDWSVAHKTASGVALYTIPVVVHVLHSYGAELLPDTSISGFIDATNRYLLKKNADTAAIIDKFKPIASSTQIALKLATKDPDGNPTKGIEHIHSYLGYTFQDYCKVHQWPQDKYLNIWVVNSPTYTGGYATTPYTAAYSPLYDGIMVVYTAVNASINGAYYLSRYLNLPRACDYFSTSCLDNDLIPDTPPCGSACFYGCSLYDSVCDTPNVQNITNENTCGNMFTYGQGQYMQTVLQLDYGKRDSLVSASNFIATGMDSPIPDMLPVPDFSLSYPGNPRLFCTPGQSIPVSDKSWNDTITSWFWTFSNGASLPTSTVSSLINTFSQPGWVTTSLTVTGNNSGTATLTNNHALFIADTTPVAGYGYFQDFNSGGDLDKWPTFNYYNNNFKWQPASPGYYDNACIMYTSYDPRTFPANTTGSPQGDIDDMFTPAFDLTGIAGDYYLNFMSSGATLTALPGSMRDTLEIAYSSDRTTTWHTLKSLSKGELDNAGTVTVPFAPLGMFDWAPHAILLPPEARTRQTFFRFRYKPGADTTGFTSTGNNFYLDRFNFGPFPASATNLIPGHPTVTILSNPTSTDAFIVIASSNAGNTASITVSDLTGKIVYIKNAALYNGDNKIEIPATALGTRGL